MSDNCGRCDLCGTQDIADGILRDWSDDPHYGFCLKCAAGIADAQWHSPGDVIGGTAPSRARDTPTVADKFLAFHTAEFWAMVWEGRVKYPLENRSQPRDETATAKRLYAVDLAMSSCLWERALELLEPVGAPGWGAREGPALYAFRPENCARVSSAWCRLREYRLGQLPETIIETIRLRGFRQDSDRRVFYEQEQREMETEIMLALRAELRGGSAPLSDGQQKRNDYAPQVDGLNRWIRSKTRGNHG